MVATIVYSCTAILFIDFISIYTKGITDANYFRPTYMYIVVAGQFFNCIRQPYQLLVQAAGHYRQTKMGAILEPVLNISVSVVIVFKYGLVGVAIGTLVAIIFRTLQYTFYVSKFLIKGSIVSTIKNLCLSILEMLLIIGIINILPSFNVSNYLQWGIKAIFTFIISFIVVMLITYLFFKDNLSWLIKKIKAAIF